MTVRSAISALSASGNSMYIFYYLFKCRKERIHSIQYSVALLYNITQEFTLHY